MSAWPTSAPIPRTTLKVPSGKPAVRKSSADGCRLDGLHYDTVASNERWCQPLWSGWFHDVICPTKPRILRVIGLNMLPRDCGAEPSVVRETVAMYSIRSGGRASRAFSSCIALPVCKGSSATWRNLPAPFFRDRHYHQEPVVYRHPRPDAETRGSFGVLSGRLPTPVAERRW